MGLVEAAGDAGLPTFGVPAGDEDLCLGAGLAIVGNGAAQGIGKEVDDPGLNGAARVIAQHFRWGVQDDFGEERRAFMQTAQAHGDTRQDTSAPEISASQQVDLDGGAHVDDDAVLAREVHGGGEQAAAAVKAEAFRRMVVVRHGAAKKAGVGFADLCRGQGFPPGGKRRRYDAAQRDGFPVGRAEPCQAGLLQDFRGWQ